MNTSTPAIMELQARRVSSAEDFLAFASLLTDAKLPFDQPDYKKHILVCYYDGDALIGTGGLEVYHEYALLRSVAVKLGARGMSIGSFIINDLISQARQHALQALYLLTDTAHGFFSIKGFKDVDKGKVPQAIRHSTEFIRMASGTSACMYLALQAGTN